MLTAGVGTLPFLATASVLLSVPVCALGARVSVPIELFLLWGR